MLHLGKLEMSVRNLICVHSQGVVTIVLHEFLVIFEIWRIRSFKATNESTKTFLRQLRNFLFRRFGMNFRFSQVLFAGSNLRNFFAQVQSANCILSQVWISERTLRKNRRSFRTCGKRNFASFQSCEKNDFCTFGRHVCSSLVLFVDWNLRNSLFSLIWKEFPFSQFQTCEFFKSLKKFMQNYHCNALTIT